MVVSNDRYPDTESFAAPVSPNVSVVISDAFATPNPVTVSIRLRQQIVWTSATTGGAVTAIEIDFAGKPQPFAGSVNGTKLTLTASPYGTCASGPILVVPPPPLPTIEYNYKVKIGGQWGLSAGIRIDP